MLDLALYSAQIISSIILLNFGVRIFKLAGGYRTTYGRFTYHVLIIGICFTLVSFTSTLRYLRPSFTPLLNSVEVVYSLLLSYSFLIAGLELMASQKKTNEVDIKRQRVDAFKGHLRGIVPHHIKTMQ